MGNGKKTIISFIYDGYLDWYVRIPHSNTKGVCTADNYNHKYFSKRDHVFQDCIDWRLMMMKELEQKGLRTLTPGPRARGRWLSSAKFEKEALDGMYDKYIK